MQTTIHYGNLKRSPMLEEYIHQEMGRLDKFPLEKASADIWLESEGSIETHGNPAFNVKLRLVRPKGKEFFVKKKGKDFFRSLSKTVKSLERVLRKEK